MTYSLYSNNLNTTSTNDTQERSSILVLSTRTTPQVHLTYNQNVSDFRIGEEINLNTSEFVNQPTSQQLKDEHTYRKYGKIFFLISLISAALVILFESYMFAVLNIHKHLLTDAKYIEISIYLALFIFAGIYQILITGIALYSTNLILLVFLMLFYCCMLLYTGIQYDEVSTKITSILEGDWKRTSYGLNIATIGVIGLTLILQSFVLYFGLRKYVNWFTFKKIGADLKLKKLYNIFQIHRSILLLDFFFFVGFTIQFLVIMVNDKNSEEFILTIIVLPLTIVILFISDISSTREFIWGTIFAICIYICGITYVLFKLIRLYTRNTSAYGLALKPGGYFLGKNSLLVFGIITLILLSTTIVLEVLAMFNYNKGLLDFVNKSYRYIPGYKKPKVHEINIHDCELKQNNDHLID